MARLSDLVREQPAEPFRQGAAEQSHARIARGGRDSACKWYAMAKEELSRVRDAIRANVSPQLDRCHELAGALVRELHQSDECVQCALHGQTDDYMVGNAVHVAVIGVKIGVGLHYTREDLEGVALAGMLHDVGMWTLPASLIEKAGTLTTEEQVAVRAHPERGRRILAGLGESYAGLSSITAQEHERWDGSGYPCRLKGTQITEQAQIIGLADVFDALITARPYKKNIAPHHALRELLVHGKQTFSHRVLKALGDQVTLYPIGTAVRLNTGEIGTVSRVNPRYPLRPTIMVSHDGGMGRDGHGSELDLGRQASVYIVEVLQAADAA